MPCAETVMPCALCFEQAATWTLMLGAALFVSTLAQGSKFQNGVTINNPGTSAFIKTSTEDVLSICSQSLALDQRLGVTKGRLEVRHEDPRRGAGDSCFLVGSDQPSGVSIL